MDMGDTKDGYIIRTNSKIEFKIEELIQDRAECIRHSSNIKSKDSNSFGMCRASKCRCIIDGRYKVYE